MSVAATRTTEARPRCRQPAVADRRRVLARPSVSSIVARRGGGDGVETENFLFSADGWRELLLTAVMLVIAGGGAGSGDHHPERGSLGRIDPGPDHLRWLAVFTTRRHADRRRRPAASRWARPSVCSTGCWSRRRVPSLVITLGTLYIYRGHRGRLGRERGNHQRLRHAGAFIALGTQAAHRPRADLVAVVVLLVVGYI